MLRGHVLGDTTRQQILALSRLGWTRSRIQQTTGIRRETISGYLKAAGIPVRGRGRPSESRAKPAISPPVVSTDPGQSKPAICEGAPISAYPRIFLPRYLERRPPVPLTLRQVDPLIRPLTLYRDLIDLPTGDQPAN